MLMVCEDGRGGREAGVGVGTSGQAVGPPARMQLAAGHEKKQGFGVWHCPWGDQLAMLTPATLSGQAVQPPAAGVHIAAGRNPNRDGQRVKSTSGSTALHIQAQLLALWA